MTELIRTSRDMIVMVKKFLSHDSFETMFIDEPTSYEQAARDLVTAIEDETCVAFWEALIVQSKKAINRHARWGMENCDEDGPEWWTKYQEEGI